MSKFKPSRGTLTAPGGSAIETARRRPRAFSPLTTAVVDSPSALDAASILTPSLPAVATRNPAREFALNCTLAFLYFRFSFVHEFISSSIHIDTHILIILGLISYAAWFVAGNVFTAYSEKLAWVWTAFTLWFCVATVFSSWKGGSLPVLIPYLRTIFPLLLLLPAVIANTDDLKKVMNVIGIAGTSTVLFGLFHRDFTQGRLDIGTDNSSIQDPNDFAAHIVMILPAIAYVMFAKQRSVFVKVFGAGIVCAALLEIMSTGSRGGFVALVLTIIYVVVTGSNRLRLSLLVGIPVLGLLALPFVPQQSYERIASVFNAGNAGKSASESADARRQLLIDSLKATARNPIFGVGPGVFEEYQADLAAEKHQKGMWHETHNGYTQISSECGIPQLIIYLTAVVLTFKSLKRASRSDVPSIPMIARTLATMAVGYSASIIFLANGYKFTMLVIGAITIAINQILLRSERVPE